MAGGFGLSMIIVFMKESFRCTAIIRSMANRRSTRRSSVNIPMQDQDEANKKLNIGVAMYGLAEDWRENVSEDELDEYDSNTFGPGWEEIIAPTESTTRPRAVAAAYHRKAQLLVIAFRPPTKRVKSTGAFATTGVSPWVVYEDVDFDMWTSLRDNASSTGQWLKYSGVENHIYYKVDRTQLDEVVETKTKF